MRAARLILALAALVLAVGLFAPARWFSAAPEPAQPPDITPWVLVGILAFALAALFVPSLRPRWGWRNGSGAVWTRSRWRGYQVSGHAPRMNFLTWYGLVITLTGLILQTVSGQKWAQRLPPVLGMKVGLIGVAIFFVGAVFTRRSGAQTKITWLDTGKTIRRREYYRED